MNASDNDFKTVEKTGGSKTHAHSQGSTGGPSNNTSGSTVLTTDQIPSHNHEGLYWYSYAISVDSGGGSVTMSSTGSGNEKTAAKLTVGSKGGGKGHTHTLSSHTHTNPNTNSASSLDPYITVYVWKRTA